MLTDDDKEFALANSPKIALKKGDGYLIEQLSNTSSIAKLILGFPHCHLSFVPRRRLRQQVLVLYSNSSPPIPHLETAQIVSSNFEFGEN